MTLKHVLREHLDRGMPGYGAAASGARQGKAWIAALLLACAAQATAREPAVRELCTRAAARLPGVSAQNCIDSGLEVAPIRSVQGNPILVRDIKGAAPTKASTGQSQVRVLLIGGIHGDELSASSIVFRWMNYLDHPDAQRYHWRIAPLVNPDGLLATKPSRVNASGVDLNRNFPTPNWENSSQAYWEKQTRRDKRRFPGNKPLSEPESRWVHEQIDKFHPDVIVSVHAPLGVLDFDGPARPPSRFGRLHLNQVGVYPGSLGNYSGMHRGIPVITIELPEAQRLPSDVESKRIWTDMLAWIGRNIVSRKVSS